jgi:hypothetical protein
VVVGLRFHTTGSVIARGDAILDRPGADKVGSVVPRFERDRLHSSISRALEHYQNRPSHVAGRAVGS